MCHAARIPRSIIFGQSFGVHLLKCGALLNRQKLGNLVLYMSLGSMLAMCFKFDRICGRKDSKFDTEAANGQPNILSVESEPRDT